MQYTFHLTDDCNLACRYCGLEQNHHYMDRTTAFQAVDLALEAGQSSIGIGFYGGEPLLCKQLIQDIVRYAKSKNTKDKKIFFKLTTNGLLLDDEFLHFTKQENIFISLSMDGNKQSHDRNRTDCAGNGSYDKLLSVIPKLLFQNPYTAVLMTVAPNTLEYFYEGVRNIYDLGFMNIICALDYSADWEEKDLLKLRRQYKKLAAFYYERTVSEHKFFFSPFDSKIDSHVRNRDYCRERCKLGYEQISVAPDGSLYPCIQFVRDSRYRIGHAGTGIEEARRKEIYQESRTEHENCRHCAVKERCLHSCACVNKYSTGSLTEPSPVLCANERMLIAISDRIAAKLYAKRSGMFLHKHYNENYALVSLAEDSSQNK